MTVEGDSSEGAFGKALRRHGGEAGGEMALAFREHELGLSQRLADLQLNLRETIVDQGAAARQARWISAVTLAIVLGMTGGGAVLFKDIGRLEVKSDNLSTAVMELGNRVDALHKEIQEIFNTVRSIDERTRDMANRAAFGPSTIPGSGEVSGPDSQLLVEPGDANPMEVSPRRRVQIGDVEHLRLRALDSFVSNDLRQAAQQINEAGFTARPMAIALNDAGITYEQLLQDYDFASQAIAETTAGRSIVRVGEAELPEDWSRQICRIGDDASSLRFGMVVEDLGGEILCIDSLDQLLIDLLRNAIVVDIDTSAERPPID